MGRGVIRGGDDVRSDSWQSCATEALQAVASTGSAWSEIVPPAGPIAFNVPWFASSVTLCPVHSDPSESIVTTPLVEVVPTFTIVLLPLTVSDVHSRGSRSHSAGISDELDGARRTVAEAPAVSLSWPTTPAKKLELVREISTRIRSHSVPSRDRAPVAGSAISASGTG